MLSDKDLEYLIETRQLTEDPYKQLYAIILESGLSVEDYVSQSNSIITKDDRRYFYFRRNNKVYVLVSKSDDDLLREKIIEQIFRTVRNSNRIEDIIKGEIFLSTGRKSEVLQILKTNFDKCVSELKASMDNTDINFFDPQSIAEFLRDFVMSYLDNLITLKDKKLHLHHFISDYFDGYSYEEAKQDISDFKKYSRHLLLVTQIIWIKQEIHKLDINEEVDTSIQLPPHKFTWKGNPSQLVTFVDILVKNGYIEPLARSTTKQADIVLSHFRFAAYDPTGGVKGSLTGLFQDIRNRIIIDTEDHDLFLKIPEINQLKGKNRQ